ncbi:MAG: anthranilate synthase component I family protein, partial [Bacteroidota bacterium]
MESATTSSTQQQKFRLRIKVRRMLADTMTPVSIYLKLRDQFASSVLLESTDFRSKENCFSFIGVAPIAGFQVQNFVIQRWYPNGERHSSPADVSADIPTLFQDFVQQFEMGDGDEYGGVNGFFGHTSFDAYQYFDTLRFDPDKRKTDQPDINYQLYRYIIAINHFKDELFIVENLYGDQASGMDRIETLISSPTFGTYN